MEQYIELKTAQLAKQAKFDWVVKEYYIKYHPNHEIITAKYPYETNGNAVDTNISRPSQTVLARWIREVHNIYVFVPYTNKQGYYVNQTLLSNDMVEVAKFILNDTSEMRYYSTPEEALEQGLQFALQYILKH